MVPKDRSNPNSYKVRRAKVGGYKDYFDDQQVKQIDAYVAENLSAFFGYAQAEQTADNTADLDSQVRQPCHRFLATAHYDASKRIIMPPAAASMLQNFKSIVSGVRSSTSKASWRIWFFAISSRNMVSLIIILVQTLA